MEHTQLYNKILTLPNDIKAEVNDFIDFMLSKKEKEKARNHPRFGSMKNKIKIHPNFDEPLEEFSEYMN